VLFFWGYSLFLVFVFFFCLVMPLLQPSIQAILKLDAESVGFVRARDQAHFEGIDPIFHVGEVGLFLEVFRYRSEKIFPVPWEDAHSEAIEGMQFLVYPFLEDSFPGSVVLTMSLAIAEIP
jgi:hypothetical protein